MSKPRPHEPGKAVSKTILIVDDEPRIRELGEVALGRHPAFEALVAKDGPSAIELCRSAHPDLVFLDIMMPGMDGYDVCRALKGDPATAAIKIVVLTAFAQHATMQQALAAGADDYMTKPFRPAQLVEKALALLGV